MLDACDIVVNFGGVIAVDGVSLDVQKNEIVGLIGPNGSGKSTFLNALTGIVPARGRVTLAGAPVRLGRPRRIRRMGILRTFQTPQPFLSLSTLENVALSATDRAGASLAGSWLARPRMWRAEHERWADAGVALERVGLDRFAQAPAASLTYGQRRLLDLARAINGAPKMLMLDEPAAGLNAVETEQLVEILHSIRDDGVSLLLVEHKIDFIDTLCDRIVVLELGRVLATGTPDSVWKDEAVVDAYLGKAPGAAREAR